MSAFDRWTQLPSGARNYMMAPERTMVRIKDIAHILARKGRFNYGSRQTYSIAQHSVHVAEVVRKLAAAPAFGPGGELAYALLHDSGEAYGFDLASPYKSLPEFEWVRRLESRQVYQILVQLDLGFGTTDGRTLQELEADQGLEWWMTDRIKQADELLLCAEASRIMPIDAYWVDRVAKAQARGWTVPDLADLAGSEDVFWTAERAEREFLDAYWRYTGRKV